MEDGFDYQTAIEEFQDERPVWKQIWAAIITEFTPDKKNWFGAAFSFVLALILTIIIARSEETVSLAGKICGILLDVGSIGEKPSCFKVFRLFYGRKFSKNSMDQWPLCRGSNGI